MSRDPRYSTAAWKNVRGRVLDRDGWRCTADHLCPYKAPGSLKTAPKRIAQAHHIVDSSEGGGFYDEWNLMAVCRDFNVGERNRRQNRRARDQITPPVSHVTPSPLWGKGGTSSTVKQETPEYTSHTDPHSVETKPEVEPTELW